MPDTETIQVTQAAATQPDESAQIRPESLARRAAAVEAAYILEAVRK